jgi:hypothetical protein
MNRHWSRGALGDVFDLCSGKAMQMVNVHMPTADGRELVLSRYTQPEPVHRMLLDQLHLALPERRSNRLRRSPPDNSTPLRPLPPCSGDLGGRLQSDQQLSGVARGQLRKMG